MGLLITPNTEKITINGSPIELDSLYVRLQFFAHPDGKTLEIAFNTYYDKDAYLNEQPLPTNIGNANFKVELQGEEQQTLDQAHLSAKQGFEQWGYNATIIL